MMLVSMLKSDLVKRLCLLAVMVLLGFNMSVYMLGWPSTQLVLVPHHHERLQNRRLTRSRSSNGTRNATAVDELAPWFRVNITELVSVNRNVTTVLPPPLPCASCK